MSATLLRFRVAGAAPLAQEASAQSGLSALGGLSVPLWWCALIVGALLLCLGALWHNRRRHVVAERELLAARRELGRRVVERTDKLRSINTRLYGEISRHQGTERLLRETEQYLHEIINSMPSIMIGISPEGRVTHWNNSAERSTGLSAAQALGHPVEQVYTELPVRLEAVRAVIASGRAETIERRRHGEGSTARYSDITIFPLRSQDSSGAVIQIDDVSMKVGLENMMIQNEKMVALGELAAGMAHEINNPLSVVLQSAQNIQRRLSPDLAANRATASEVGIELAGIRSYLEQREIPHFIDSIREAGERAASIVENLLEFSRYGNRLLTQVDVVALIEHALQLAAPAMAPPKDGAPGITVQRDFPVEPPPPLRCYAAELEQVLLNLLRNATQALREESSPSRQEPLVLIRLRGDAQGILIDVEDNGPGMPESVRRHIFEPFYTTKTVGQGTGLGLSVSYFIITEHHGGSIEVSSRRGRGTCFSIRLPLEPPHPKPASESG